MTVIQSGEGLVKVSAWCSEFEMGIDVDVRPGSEPFKAYGQGLDPYSEVIPAWDGPAEPSPYDYYTFNIFFKDQNADPPKNNNPDFGAITFVGNTTGKVWYVGVDGSSTVAVQTSTSPYTCDITGVIMTNFANTLEEPFYLDHD
jgi:hypothetical protein